MAFWSEDQSGGRPATNRATNRDEICGVTDILSVGRPLFCSRGAHGYRFVGRLLLLGVRCLVRPQPMHREELDGCGEEF